jgi:RimJ/RimL family protein N-acetyltransferase
MDYELNQYQQPIGRLVENWNPPPPPPGHPLQGHYCRLEGLDPDKHTESLFAANRLDTRGLKWTYMPYGPFDNLEEYRAWVEQQSVKRDPLFYAILDAQSDRAVGVASYLRITPASGSIEVGHLCFSPLLQRTVAATEAMYLMMAHAFELGYRRYEWKCNALNQSSRFAAQRFGLSYEGLFRQATVVKGRNRDTAWFAAMDSEWPAIKAAFEKWLAPTNFDEDGKQKVRLSELTWPLLYARDPLHAKVATGK